MVMISDIFETNGEVYTPLLVYSGSFEIFNGLKVQQNNDAHYNNHGIKIYKPKLYKTTE